MKKLLNIWKYKPYKIQNWIEYFYNNIKKLLLILLCLCLVSPGFCSTHTNLTSNDNYRVTKYVFDDQTTSPIVEYSIIIRNKTGLDIIEEILCKAGLIPKTDKQVLRDRVTELEDKIKELENKLAEIKESRRITLLPYVQNAPLQISTQTFILNGLPVYK